MVIDPSIIIAADSILILTNQYGERPFPTVIYQTDGTYFENKKLELESSLC